jgi:hypothetical protein
MAIGDHTLCKLEPTQRSTRNRAEHAVRLAGIVAQQHKVLL